MTSTAPEIEKTATLLEAFQAPCVEAPSVDHLFAGVARYVVQTPPVRNDYKKQAGSSDGARTYDTTST
ncbi:hypothetical protein [Spirillospora sp. NBC_01491]|uniref:hypothetical protein n=1 Tax=Spirillospora sp. NBC_01491 TaxID=2976007 RepID=UPI002E2FC27A|nr:hypothetical protein [Spirillospora sp. NBC_01491]